MPLQYTNLDEKTRPFMVAELERDNAQGTLYLSPRLTANGQNVWLELLREAASATRRRLACRQA